MRADSVSPRMNTNASRDLVVSYNCCLSANQHYRDLAENFMELSL